MKTNDVEATVLRQALVDDGIADAGGFVAVPTAPGLGVDIDEDVLESLGVDR